MASRKPEVGDTVEFYDLVTGRDIRGEVVQVLSSQFLVQSGEPSPWFVLFSAEWRKID